MKVKIIGGCIGCGLCASTCPDVFEMDDEGFATVITNPDSSNEDLVREASENCPASVIIIED